MADISKVNVVAIGDVSKIDGVAKASISKFGGADVPSGTEQATRWLIGANAGRLYINDSPAGSFLSSSASGALGLAVDKGSMNFYNVAYGNDETDEPRWIAHSDNVSNDLYHISSSQDVTDTNNWIKVNVTNGKLAKRGGPGLRFGNGKWFAVGGGRHAGSDHRMVMMSSSNGGNSWVEVDDDTFIGTSNTGYVVYHVSDDTWVSPLGVTSFYKTTDAKTWASGSGKIASYEAYCMGYDSDNERYVVGTNSGKLYYNDDDFASAPIASVSPFGSSNVWGVIYVKGSINKWVAIASNGKIAYSSDGQAFTASTLPSPIGSSHHMRAIASDHTTIVAVGSTNGGNNSILSSSNGTDWTYVSSSAVGNVNFESIACNVISAPSS